MAKALSNAKENHDNLSVGGYLVGLACVFCTAWCYSTVGVLTKYLNSIHFSVMLFHYAWSASTILIIYLSIDYLFSDLVVPRLFTYNLQLYGLTLGASLLNAFGMNLCTIAWQCEKSAFIALMGYASVLYGFMVDISLFGIEITWQQLAGAGIILVFNLYAIFVKIVKEGQK